MKKGIVVVISGLVAFFSAEKIYAQTASGTLSKDTAKIKSSAPDEYEQILQKKRETSNNAAEQTPVKKDTIRKVVVVKSNNPQVVPAGSVVIKKPVLIKENYVGFNTAPMLNQFFPLMLWIRLSNW